MTDDGGQSAKTAGAGFTERTLDADGFRIRYLEAGHGPPVVCVHGAGGLRLSRTHDLLAKSHRVLAFEVPGFGASPANTKSATIVDLAGTMNRATTALDLQRYSLIGTSFGGKLALRMAIAAPDRLEALVLISPAAIKLAQPVGGVTGGGHGPELLYAYPERHTHLAAVPRDIAEKQQALVRRLSGPPRDAELETAMQGLKIPTLVLFGTRDRITPSQLGRHYRELLPNCYLMMIYDAAHALDADRPEAVASVIGDFLERKDSFLVTRESGLIHP